MSVTLNWPLSGLILGLVAIGVFRQPIIALLERTEKVKDWLVAPKQPTLPPVAGGELPEIAAEEQKRVEELTRGFDNQLLLIQERRIREDLAGHGFAADSACEKVLIKHLAGAQILVSFEKLLAEIYGSQVTALRWLNGQANGAVASSLRPFYDAAAIEWPGMYEGYGFGAWLAFLAGRRLIVDTGEPAEEKPDVNAVRIEITVLGREFLAFLVNGGRTDPFVG